MRESLEWLAIATPVIVRGRIETIAVGRNGTGSEWDLVTLRVTETIKGPKAEGVLFMSPTYRKFPEKYRRAQAAGLEILVFLEERRKDQNEPELFSRYLLWPRSLNVESVLVLSKESGDSALTMDLRLLTRPEAILANLRAGVRAAPKSGEAKSYGFSLPQKMPDGSRRVAEMMIVPVDARLDRVAKEWVRSRDLGVRTNGATALGFFRLNANISILRRLLNDPGRSPVTLASTEPMLVVDRRPVRQAAQDALSTWGILWESKPESQRVPGEMVEIPAGEFTMGENAKADDRYDARPLHKVTLPTFWISKTSVTVGQFRAYTKATGAAFDWETHRPRLGWRDDHPMVMVTWGEARAYCRWAGGDLATEAQWEKAGRGTDGRIFAYGDVWQAEKQQSWPVTIAGDYRTTAPVGRFPEGASPYGLLDLSGNVRCWCLDFRSLYSDPNSVQEEQRVIRGGSYQDSSSSDFQLARRLFWMPGGRAEDIGFRLASLKRL